MEHVENFSSYLCLVFWDDCERKGKQNQETITVWCESQNIGVCADAWLITPELRFGFLKK